jgi:hypothetical protein
MGIWQVRAFRFVWVTALLALGTPLMANDSPQVPVVDGGLGSCRADFQVKDEVGKPIYNANIKVTIKYGFFSVRKTVLEIGTNSDGRARFTGLPDMPKKPLEFEIKSGTVSKLVTDDPSTNCNANFEVTLSVR